MNFKRFSFIILCFLIVLSSYGCIALLLDGIASEVIDDTKGKNPAVVEVSDPEDHKVKTPPDEVRHNTNPTDQDDDGDVDDVSSPDLYTLDMSSDDAFIDDVLRTYGVELIDRRSYLSGSDGEELMRELNHALSLFAPDFIRALVTEYSEYGARFFIRLEGPSYTEFGMTEWDRDLTITLHYHRDPEENGITAAVLAHELAHAAHFVIEEYLGEARSLAELRHFNGPFDYVEDDYDYVWDYDKHGSYFAYDYGMYDYYEDFATIIEMLVAFPEDLLERFSDFQYEALFQKTAYLRDIMYYYISDACFPVFAPLYEAEKIWDAPAA